LKKKCDKEKFVGALYITTVEVSRAPHAAVETDS
jgi:hypothetical protein